MTANQVCDTLVDLCTILYNHCPKSLFPLSSDLSPSDELYRLFPHHGVYLKDWKDFTVSVLELLDHEETLFITHLMGAICSFLK